MGMFSKYRINCQQLFISTKIFSCKYGEHLCMNKNKERDFKSQIIYFLILALTQSPTFSDQRCKQIKTKVDTSWNSS